MGICGCSSNKEFRPGQALMYKEDHSMAEGIHKANQGRKPSDPDVVLHPDENIGGMDRIHLPLIIKRIESPKANSQAVGSKDFDQKGQGLAKKTSIGIEEEAGGSKRIGSKNNLPEPSRRDDSRKKSTIINTKKNPITSEQELRDLLKKKQIDEENDKKRKQVEEEIRIHLEDFNRNKQREEQERDKQKEITRPSSKETKKNKEEKKQGLNESEMKEKVDEPLTKVNRSPKNKLSIIETKININPEEPSRHGSGKANSPVNLMVQERGQRSQLNPPKSSNSPLVEANNHQLLKAENRPELESIEVERLKVSSGDLDNGEIRSPYIVNTIKEVTEPDLSIMYPRKRNESRLHSGEAKSIFASNRQLLNKKLFNIEGKSDLSKGENLKVLEEIKLQELVCKAVPNFAQKLINKHLMTRGDQMEEKPKSTPAKKTSGFTKELQADDSYKLKRIEAVDHQEQSHIFDGEYMAFSAQGSLRKDKEN